MKLSILLLALTAAAFSSCTTAYKTTQTPDDVYFSPTRPEADEYVQVEKRDDRSYRGSEDYYEDRFLRMRMQDRNRWSALDDYYFNNTYAYNSYGYYNNFHSPWNNYYTWNNFYNPYYSGIPCYSGSVIIKNPRSFTPPSRAIVFNPNSYSTSNNANRPVGTRNISNGYNNRNSNRNSFGESVRKVFTNSNSNSNGNYNSNSNSNNSTPTRSYTPSSNSNSNSSSTPSRSSSSSSGGSSGGGSSRPPR